MHVPSVAWYNVTIPNVANAPSGFKLGGSPMTVAPLIAMKSSQVKSFDAVGRELDRRAHTYANDIDGSGRHIGYRCRAEDERPVPLEKAVERRMGELKTKRKVRDNQVRAMGFIVSSNDALDEKTAREFLDRSINWFGARYGYENLLAAQIHLDEETPHAHFGFVPLRDGKLSWKGFFPDKAALGAMQDRFYGRVGALYGLSRGEKRIEGQPARRHKSVAEYKAESRRVQAELDEKAEQLEAAREELASTRAQLAECRSQVEGFAARFERIKVELAQIAECLSVRGFLGSFKAKLAEFAENPICKAALAAGRAFENARDGRRAEKVLVDGAKKKVGEMDRLAREMGEWSPFDEVDEGRAASRELERSGGARGFGARGGDAI